MKNSKQPRKHKSDLDNVGENDRMRKAKKKLKPYKKTTKNIKYYLEEEE